MAYLTYEEYQNYGGRLTESDFTVAEFKARKRIDYLTDNRVQDMAQVPEAVRLCILTLIKADSKVGVDAQAENPLITSFNTDGYSESYGSASDQAAALNKAADRTVRSMLYGELDDNGTPLLYRGLDI